MNTKNSFSQTISALFIFGTVLSGNAFAHAHLKSSEPSKDSVISVMPATVTLHFSEALEASMSKVEVKDLTDGKIISEGKLSHLNDDKSTLQIALKSPTLITHKCRIEVSWKAVAKDSHKMPGKIEFTFDPAPVKN